MRLGTSCLYIAPLLMWASSVQAASAEIKSTFDPRQESLSWLIKNTADSPIDQVEIPHFHAASCIPPEGWTAHCTNLGGTEIPSQGGLCTVTAGGAHAAIAPGSSRSFLMQLTPNESDLVGGEIRVHLANGKTEAIGNVQVSAKAHQGFGLVPTIVLAGVFGLYVIWRWVRGRTVPPPDRGPSDEAI